jgi:hypothetical protein
VKILTLTLTAALALSISLTCADPIEQFANACPEGHYRDLAASCSPLLRPGLGFDRSAFLADFEPFARNVQWLDRCDEARLAEALAAVEQAGGGIVAIPACTIPVSDKLHVPSNTILRGRGLDTRLVAVPGFDTHLLDIESRKNVVVQDLALVGAGASGKGIVIRASQNLLVERLGIDAFGHSNLMFRHSRGITVRYVVSTNAGEFHGIDSKDCSPSDPGIPDLRECQASAGNLGRHGTLFSRDYAVYSNYFVGNGGQGIDIHASDGEVAGNYSLWNSFAAKFPDAMRVLIHHNRFDWGRGIKFYNTHEVPGRGVRDVVLYRNEFRILQGIYALRNGSHSESLYLIDNHYDPAGERRIVNPGGTVFTCPQTEETQTLVYDYHPSRAAPAEFCTGTGFMSLFD